MPWRLTPRSASFGEPLHALASTCAAAAGSLRDVVGLPPADRAAPLERLQDLEREGAALRGQIVALVDDTFVTPVDRRDLVGMVCALDCCLDAMELAGDLVTRLRLPQGPTALAGHVDVLILLADLVAGDAGLLLRPGEAGRLTTEIRRLEDVADRHYRDALTALLDGQGDPVSTMAQTVVLERLEGAVSAFERLASVLEAAGRAGF